jgi:hypothetical protein
MADAERQGITIRFDCRVLAAAKRYAALSNPPISLNAAINFLVKVGLEHTEPDRIAELRRTADLANLLEKLSNKLDTPSTD